MEILGTGSSLSSALPSTLFSSVADLRGTFNVLHAPKLRQDALKACQKVRKYPVGIYIIYRDPPGTRGREVSGLRLIRALFRRNKWRR